MFLVYIMHNMSIVISSGNNLENQKVLFHKRSGAQRSQVRRFLQNRVQPRNPAKPRR